MYEEEIHFGKLFPKQFEMVLEHLTLVTLTFDILTPISIGFLCLPGWICGLSLRKVGQGILKLLIWNVFGTFNLDLWPSDRNINRVHLLPRMDVSTRYEEGWSRHSPVIDQKWFWQIWPRSLWHLTQFSSYWSEMRRLHTDRQTDRQTNRPTDMCKEICTLFFEGGHN